MSTRSPAIQLRRGGAHFAGTEADLERLRREFETDHCIKIEQPVEPALAAELARETEKLRFEPKAHGSIGAELCLADPAQVARLEFLANDRRLLELIERVAGTGHVGCFSGRVYKLAPRTGHYDSWHNDLGDGRLVAMSINFTTEPYTGGILQIREAASGRVVKEAANQGLGDAVVFRISPALEHRVTPVVGAVARTAFAGWFCSDPDYYEMLAQLRAAASPASEPVRTSAHGEPRPEGQHGKL